MSIDDEARTSATYKMRAALMKASGPKATALDHERLFRATVVVLAFQLFDEELHRHDKEDKANGG
jgi:hypothetical protein